MSNNFSIALWLALNLEVKNDGSLITLGDLHDACNRFFLENFGTPAPNKDIISKLIKRIFDIQSTTTWSNKFIPSGGRTIIFKNIGNRSMCSNNTFQLPPFCKAIETEPFLKISCPLPTVIDGVQQCCTVGFEPRNLWIEINETKLSAGFQVTITNSNITGIILLISSMKLCNGATKDEGYMPKTFKEERISTFDTCDRHVMRSKHCRVILEWLTSQNVCLSCNLSRSRKHNDKKRIHLNEIQKSTDLNKNMDKNKENTEQVPAKVSKTVMEDKENNSPLPSLSTKPRDLEEISIETFSARDKLFTQSDKIMLGEKDQKDMEDIIEYVLKSDLPEDFVILLKSQLQNCDKNIDIHQRRWDPKIISLCLTLYIRSPQAYEDLKKSNFLQLPSKRLLQYYKNSVKQIPGFNQANLIWMSKEMQKQNVSEFGKHGGIIIDEMTIQDDLIITKSGDTWNLVGFVDMDETNNNIEIISKEKKNINLATHALQFIFHGLTGFRWPVVYFGSNPATAHQLYTTFWKCVDLLGELNVYVDYVMMDGASTNRTFAEMLFPEPPITSNFMFSDVFFQQHKICYIQDIMHVFKKIRNNIESSKIENRTGSGRYLILGDTCIVWDHWKACFQFNFQNGFSIHRKLTEEHINLTPASKMRNELAIQVLNKDMLYLMKQYQMTLSNPENISGSIQLLEHTSDIIEIFCTTRQPIVSLNDNRFEVMTKVLKFFNSWEETVEKSVMLVGSKNLFTKETRSDINSSLMGFCSLCKNLLNGKNSINPGYVNSDIIENLFGQQRGLRNGLNTNPTLAQYGPSNTAIILGQCTISNKSNSSNKASFFASTTPCALNTVRNKANKLKRRGIRL